MDLANTYLSYRLIKLLSTQFIKWKAYKLGLIDKEGNVLRKPETKEEKNAFSSFDRIILNIKRAITKLTGHSKAAAIISTLVLLKDDLQIPFISYLLQEGELMPNNLVKSYAEKTGKSVERVEYLWNKAKGIVKDEYPDKEEKSPEFFELVVGTLKKMLSIKEDSLAAELPMIDNPLRLPDGVDINGIHYFDVDIEDTNIPNILNGRERYKRWREFIKDRGIHNWANRTFKPFSIKTKNGIFFRMR